MRALPMTSVNALNVLDSAMGCGIIAHMMDGS
jgi:hypothetical protein